MTFADAEIDETPKHARPQPRRNRRYRGLAVLGLYLIAIGLNEWRLQRHVEAVRARENIPAVVELSLDP